MRTHPFSFKVTEESLEAYQKAAEEAGMTTSEWARVVLDAAAGRLALPRHLLRVVKVEETKPKKVRDGDW